jgi:hypothetical protein
MANPLTAIAAKPRTLRRFIVVSEYALRSRFA